MTKHQLCLLTVAQLGKPLNKDPEMMSCKSVIVKIDKLCKGKET